MGLLRLRSLANYAEKNRPDRCAWTEPKLISGAEHREGDFPQMHRMQ
jgi:hypothetical protein